MFHPKLVGFLAARTFYECVTRIPVAKNASAKKAKEIKSANDYYDVIATNAPHPEAVKVWLFGEGNPEISEIARKVISSYQSKTSSILPQKVWDLRPRTLERTSEHTGIDSLIFKAITWVFQPALDLYKWHISRKVSENQERQIPARNRDLRRAIEVRLSKHDKVFALADPKQLERLDAEFLHFLNKTQFAVVVPKIKT